MRKTLVQALGAAFCAILCALSGMGGGGMMIGARTGAWTPSGAPLPYDAEVEWLECDNHAFVILPDQYIKSNVDSEVSLVLKRTGNVGIHRLLLIQSKSAADSIYGIWTTTGDGVSLFSYVAGETLLFSDTSKHNVKLVYSSSSRTVASFVDDVQVGGEIRPIISKIGDTASLFAATDGSVPCMGLQLFTFSVRHDGVLAIDMIPVRFTNENGVSEGAMYDRVSGQLFRNAGTGAFIIGPDKTI